MHAPRALNNSPLDPLWSSQEPKNVKKCTFGAAYEKTWKLSSRLHESSILTSNETSSAAPWSLFGDLRRAQWRLKSVQGAPKTPPGSLTGSHRAPRAPKRSPGSSTELPGPPKASPREHMSTPKWFQRVSKPLHAVINSIENHCDNYRTLT